MVRPISSLSWKAKLELLKSRLHVTNRQLSKILDVQSNLLEKYYMSITPTEEVGLKIDEALKTFHKDYRKVNLIVIHESYMAREDLDDLMRQVHREGLLNEYHIISSSKEEMKDEAIVNNTGDIRIRIHRDPDLNQRQVDQYFAIIVMNMICRIQPQNVGSVSILADAKQFRPLCEFISKDYGITCSFV